MPLHHLGDLLVGAVEHVVRALQVAAGHQPVRQREQRGAQAARAEHPHRLGQLAHRGEPLGLHQGRVVGLAVCRLQRGAHRLLQLHTVGCGLLDVGGGGVRRLQRHHRADLGDDERRVLAPVRHGRVGLALHAEAVAEDELVELVGERLPPLVGRVGQRGEHGGGVAGLDRLADGGVPAGHGGQVVQAQRRLGALHVAEAAAQPDDRAGVAPTRGDDAGQAHLHLAGGGGHDVVAVEEVEDLRHQVVDALPRLLQRQGPVQLGLVRHPLLVEGLLDGAGLAFRGLPLGEGDGLGGLMLGVGRVDQVAQRVVAALEELPCHGRGDVAVEAAHGGNAEPDVQRQPAGGDPEEVADRRLVDGHPFAGGVGLHQRAQRPVVHRVVQRGGEWREHPGKDLAAVRGGPHVVPRIRLGVPFRPERPHGGPLSRVPPPSWR